MYFFATIPICSQYLQEILKRITKFVTTSIMEIRIAGKFASDIVRSIVKVQ